VAADGGWAARLERAGWDIVNVAADAGLAAAAAAVGDRLDRLTRSRT
jgi:hypothetical protein